MYGLWANPICDTLRELWVMSCKVLLTSSQGSVVVTDKCGLSLPKLAKSLMFL